MVRELSFNRKPLIMGIVNVTPDSFFDGGRHYQREKALDRARVLIEEGADIIDIGGESTRPFAEPVSLDEELERVVPVVDALRQESDVCISVDTYKADVAEAAINAGAAMVNDISGLTFDPRMVAVVADHNAYAVIMHIQGTPRDMQSNPWYDDVVAEIKAFLEQQVTFARQNGVRDDRIIVDPGIGFGKRVEDNLKIVKMLSSFKMPGIPLLIGTSMKSFIGSVTDSPLEERGPGTLASIALSVLNGADILRVHDVKSTRKVVRFVTAVMNV